MRAETFLHVCCTINLLYYQLIPFVCFYFRAFKKMNQQMLSFLISITNTNCFHFIYFELILELKGQSEWVQKVTLKDLFNFPRMKCEFEIQTNYNKTSIIFMYWIEIYHDVRFFIITRKDKMILRTILFLNHFSRVQAIVGGYEAEPHSNVLLN